MTADAEKGAAEDAAESTEKTSCEAGLAKDEIAAGESAVKDRDEFVLAKVDSIRESMLNSSISHLRASLVSHGRLLIGSTVASMVVGMLLLLGFAFGFYSNVNKARTEIASETGQKLQMAQLLDEIRTITAQSDAARQGDEKQRAEMLRVLQASLEASHATEKANAAASARMNEIDARLDEMRRTTKADRGFRNEVALPIDKARRQLTRRQFRFVKRKPHYLVPHLARNAVPDARWPGRLIFQRPEPARLKEAAPSVKRRPRHAELFQRLFYRQMRLFDERQLAARHRHRHAAGMDAPAEGDAGRL